MVMQIRKAENEGTWFRESWKEECRKRTRARLKQDLLKGSRKWIVWKWNVKMLKENLITGSISEY